ncbi:carbohydrate ABC transporter permease [Robinsoniella sp. KNHs210]|uniref:carbohydrate ABC transporter permease n=1 Tax=Robinsoniella sp. KNHs210 TaxID=1469950 RepID=UPI0004822409|nr:sugar ABC transporter permease [Robinsoniella sp. KNHs210]
MNKKKIYSPLFSVPAIVLYTVMFMIPVVAGIGISLTDWNTSWSKISFIGLQNYKDIFLSHGGPYLKSVEHTLSFTVVTVIGKTLLGLGLALLLNTGLRSKNLFRGLYFLPYTLAPLIIGIAFTSILGMDGPLNNILRLLGLESLVKGWLANPHTALGSTMVVEIWRMAGWNMMILLAGLQMIPKEYYEAAGIDGAGKWKQFFYVTLPFLRSSLTMVMVLNTIHGLKVFDIIYSLTGGGPGTYSEVINTQVFKEFGSGRYGMANALSVIVFLVTFIISMVMKKALVGEEE